MGRWAPRGGDRRGSHLSAGIRQARCTRGPDGHSRAARPSSCLTSSAGGPPVARGRRTLCSAPSAPHCRHCRETTLVPCPPDRGAGVLVEIPRSTGTARCRHRHRTEQRLHDDRLELTGNPLESATANGSACPARLCISEMPCARSRILRPMSANSASDFGSIPLSKAIDMARVATVSRTGVESSLVPGWPRSAIACRLTRRINVSAPSLGWRRLSSVTCVLDSGNCRANISPSNDAIRCSAHRRPRRSAPRRSQVPAGRPRGRVHSPHRAVRARRVHRPRSPTRRRGCRAARHQDVRID